MSIKRLEIRSGMVGWVLLGTLAGLVSGAAFIFFARAGFGLLHTESGGPKGKAIEELEGEREDALSEASVGAALGILSWGVGWAGWLPTPGFIRCPGPRRRPGLFCRYLIARSTVPHGALFTGRSLENKGRKEKERWLNNRTTPGRASTCSL